MADFFDATAWPTLYASVWESPRSHTCPVRRSAEDGCAAPWKGQFLTLRGELHRCSDARLSTVGVLLSADFGAVIIVEVIEDCVAFIIGDMLRRSDEPNELAHKSPLDDTPRIMLRHSGIGKGA